MILPDSTIEAAARAAWAESQKIERDPNLPPTWDDDISDHMRDGCRQLIRAALTAALPDLIEICVKVAERVETISVEKSEEDDPVIMAGFMGEFGMKRAVIHAIRSLLTNPEDK